MYKSSCMACHGVNLEGKYGPGLQKIGAKMSKEQLVKQITDGSGDMPGFAKRLDAASIEALADWLAGKK